MNVAAVKEEASVGIPRLVMIVDDDSDFLDSLEDVLRGQGFETVSAGGYDQALELSETQDARLVLVDFRLGDRNGAELISELKRRDSGKVCIMMTAYAEMGSVIDSLNNGAFGYLRKPIGIGELLTTISRGFENLDLEAEKAAINRRLEIANADLVRLDDLKNNIIANVSHELRTPLVSITGYLQLLEKELGENGRYRKWLKTAINGARKLSGLIEGMLRASSLKSESAKLDCGPVNVEQIARSAFRELEPLFENKKIAISQKYKQELRPVYGNRDMLSTAMLNVIGNAVKFTPTGGSVEISTELAQDGRVIFSCSDDGPGIPEEYQKAVFDRFFQIDSSSTRVHEGLGLGLYIAGEIIVGFGGEISAETADSGGTMIRIILPAANKPKAAESAD